MVRIRLRKVGSKGQPSFRLVAADRESPRDGRFLENLGYYNPRTDPATLDIREDRVFHWLKSGAQPSDSVIKLFQIAGTLDRYERLKQGSDLETLMVEAQTARESRAAGTKTRAAEGGSRPSRKQAEAVEAA